MGSSTDKHAEDWMPRAVVARLVGLTMDQLDKRLRPHLPDDAERGKGRNLRIHAPTAVAVWVERRVLEEVPSSAGGDDPAMMAADGESPALERYRSARAEQEEYKAAQMRGEMVTVHQVNEVLDQAGGVMRRLADEFRRKNPDAHEALEEAWSDVDRIVEERFGSSSEQPARSV